jgi:hypothetical protein
MNDTSMLSRLLNEAHLTRTAAQAAQCELDSFLGALTIKIERDKMEQLGEPPKPLPDKMPLRLRCHLRRFGISVAENNSAAIPDNPVMSKYKIKSLQSEMARARMLHVRD